MAGSLKAPFWPLSPNEATWELHMGAQACRPGSSEKGRAEKADGEKAETCAVKFCAWAPKAHSLELVVVSESVDKVFPMHLSENNFFETTLSSSDLSSLSAPLDYFFCIDGQRRRPDPASRWQPHGVHGPSRFYPSQFFEWHDGDWKGIALADFIIYELHVGTFTPEGTFEGVISKLPYLKELGITAIELMPIAEFPGERNWGYDGVHPFAPHHAYGGPEGLKKLVDACHAAGLAVILDVVYNHLGPEGNYLGEFGYYFTDRYKTPWGDAFNYDGAYCDFARQYVVDNALYWLTEYHIDALRLDAIHTYFDLGAHHILEELHTAFSRQAQALGRQAFIIAESDLNDARLLNSLETGGYHIDAQWSDDFHHALHAYLTKSQTGYLIDFGQLSQIAKALTNGFVYDGQWSRHRKKRFGNASDHLSGSQLVVCLQNHDQIGNVGRGWRLGALTSPELYKLAACLLLCSPNLPLLFMGQEWNAETPFLFFTSYGDERLIQSVREGYQRENQMESVGTQAKEEAFDPQDEQRFKHSKLAWSELQQPKHAAMLSFYQQLICLRKKWACLSNCRKDLVKCHFNSQDEWLLVWRSDPAGSQALLVVNFAAHPSHIALTLPPGVWDLQLCSSTYPEMPRLPQYIQGAFALLVPPQSALLWVNAPL